MSPSQSFNPRLSLLDTAQSGSGMRVQRQDSGARTENPFQQAFKAAAEATALTTQRKDHAMVQAAVWLSGFEPIMLEIASDFCVFLNCPHELEFSNTELVSSDGWVSRRLRVLCRFPERSPFGAGPRGKFARIWERIVRMGDDADVLMLDLELSIRWRVPADQQAEVRIDCGLGGREAVEIMDDYGVFRELPVVRRLRETVREQCLSYLASVPAEGFRLP
jgi:hypothetical protein